MKRSHILLIPLTIVMAITIGRAQVPKDDHLSKAAAMLKQSAPLRLADLAVTQIEKLSGPPTTAPLSAEERNLVGRWRLKGEFVNNLEEYRSDHTGTVTYYYDTVNARPFKQPIVVPFTWSLKEGIRHTKSAHGEHDERITFEGAAYYPNSSRLATKLLYRKE